ncbi:MAG: hypothetical protein HY961_21905 [Ignavibacteriae bacterium]|nr:hypothetical protein [Ignavibacteriota bacterium]
MERTADLIEQLSEIRSMMEKSTKILSLSGLAGVSIGVIAIGGILFVQYIHTRIPAEDVQLYVIAAAAVVLVAAIAISVLLSVRMARKKNLPIWNNVAKHMLIELAIPLFSGGVFCIALMIGRLYSMIPAAMLLFYGLALIAASKFTVREIRYLGLTELLLGLLAALVPNQALNFWALGFGLLHILYGVRMYLKYEK